MPVKEYFKLYGLNLIDVTPEEYTNLQDKDPKVLYIVAPQGYNNYTGSYDVKLYLGNVQLGPISELMDTEVWNLSAGIYKVYGSLRYGDQTAEAVGSLYDNLFGLLLLSKPNPDIATFTYIYNDKIYFGKTTTNNGAHIKNYFRTIDSSINAESADNKVTELNSSTINNTNYPTTQATANYVSQLSNYIDYSNDIELASEFEPQYTTIPPHLFYFKELGLCWIDLRLKPKTDIATSAANKTVAIIPREIWPISSIILNSYVTYETVSGIGTPEFDRKTILRDTDGNITIAIYSEGLSATNNTIYIQGLYHLTPKPLSEEEISNAT